MKKISLIIICLLGTMFTFSQNTLIQGNVSQMNSDKIESLYGANVVLLDTSGHVVKGIKTDFDGNYRLTIKQGLYRLRVSYTGLREQIITINLQNEVEKKLDFTLESPVFDQKEVLVVGIRTKTSDAAVVEEIKNDLGVKSSMGSEQITSTGASDTKEVLSKMSGVSSSQSGGVIFVRGMGDRYNSAYLNGLPLVSPNPELRVIPMDIMPTTIIDVLDVSKMMAPNLYGDFAGGVINIRTKKTYRTPELNVTIGSTTNSQVTGRNFTSYQGGKYDFFGFDDGTRALPELVKNTSMKRADPIYRDGLYNSNDINQGTGFNNNFNVITKKALPGSNFRISGGNYFKSKREGHEDRGIGFLAMLSHSTSYQNQIGTARYINAQNKLEYNFDTKIETFSTSTIGMTSVLFDISRNSSVHFNYLFINNTEDNTTQSWGYHRDYSDAGMEMYGRRNAFTQNQVNIIQLLGEEKLLPKDKLNVNWGTSYSLTNNNVPDRKQITALYNEREDLTRYNLLALDANHTHRFFSKLNEKELAAHADLKWNLFESKNGDTLNKKLDIIAGVDYKNKDRAFNFRQFNYLAKPLADAYSNSFDVNHPDNYLNDENHNAGLFRIEESANPGNGYTAFQSVLGLNVGAAYQVNRKLELIPNLRFENGFQSVTNRKQTQANIKEVNIIDGLNFMPSLAAKMQTRENQQIRFGASKTIIRPKFFEVAPFEYLAQVVGLVQIGNNKLQNATNYNMDLRYEFYTPRSSDMLIFGVFGKKLINPIEQVLLPAASGQIISFDNTNNGTVAGAEIEYAKNLSFLLKPEKRENSPLKNYSIAGNIAYIYSKIDVNDTTGFTTNSVRPLQGASPLLVNTTLKYETKISSETKSGDKKWIKIMSALSFSYSSKTLYVVGVQGIGDQYLFPTYLLNYTNQITFSNDFSIQLTCRNMLNNTYRIYQQDMVNKGEWQSVNSFKKGIDFQLLLSYSIKYKKSKIN